MYRSSTSSEASVAYAAPGDFAGEIVFFLHVMKIIDFFFADSWRLWRRGGPISLLMLTLKSRSCRLRLGAFLFLGRREAAGKGGGERLRKGER